VQDDGKVLGVKAHAGSWHPLGSHISPNGRDSLLHHQHRTSKVVEQVKKDALLQSVAVQISPLHTKLLNSGMKGVIN
jgi:hypothetical protein